jgi:hypothetical protein
MRKLVLVFGIFYTIVGLFAARGMYYALDLYDQFGAEISSGFILFLTPLVLGIIMLTLFFRPLKNKYVYPSLIIIGLLGIIGASFVYYSHAVQRTESYKRLLEQY